MTAARGTVRRQVRMACPPAAVWPYIEDPARIPEWFPGITAATVDGTTRTITLASGVSLAEEIVTNDALQRRFQYRITGPLVTEHLSTLDVLDLGDGTTLAVYAADAIPSTMALVIAGAAGHALEHLRDMLEGES